MEKAGTSTLDSENVVKKSSDEKNDAVKEVNDSNEQVPIPLHRRRFDAKRREFPSNLAVLPHSEEVETKPRDSRRFCEDLAVKLKQDGSTATELQPLSQRSASTAVAILATEDAFDHLDKLYRLMDQLLTLKDHNSKIQKRARELEHIKNLQDMHKQIEKEMQRAKTMDVELLLKNEATSMDLDEEYGYTEALLDSMLAAGRNASLKRAKWKSPSRSKLRQSIVRNQRSRSMGGEELENCDVEFQTSRLAVPYRGRSRRSCDMKVGDDKAKISKWTRVKAAFKWEKAHTGVSSVPEGVPLVASNSVLPLPASPAPPATPASPHSLSPASSIEDLTDDHSCQHTEGGKRSRSLDSSIILDQISESLHNEEETSNQCSKHKTPWGKMKDIIQTRKESVRKKQNRNSIKSTSEGRTSENHSLSDGGCMSNSESAEVLHNADVKVPKRKTSSQERCDLSHLQDTCDALRRTTPTLTITMPSSEELTKAANTKTKDFERKSPKVGEHLPKSGSQTHMKQFHQELRKQKSLDLAKKLGSRGHSSGVLDSSDADTSSPVVHRRDSKWKKVKKAFLTSASMSTPSSPSRHSSFFAEIEPDDLSSGEFNHELRSLQDPVKHHHQQRRPLEEAVRRDYAALQARLGREFRSKAREWRPTQGAGGHQEQWEQRGRQHMGYSDSSPSTPAALSSDFREPRGWTFRPPGPCSPLSADPGSSRAWPAPGQRSRGAAPVPTQAQLSEDFRRKLEEWKRLKATNSVPAYTGDDTVSTPKEHERDDKNLKPKKLSPQKKEVLVQTGAGFFRFEGISRSFTRKLHEWEKSRGIAPEVSTSALLKESLARPPLPTSSLGIGFHQRPMLHHERSMCRLQRSQSVGSVREEGAPCPLSSATAAPSLSLTRLDDCATDNQVSDMELAEEFEEALLAVGPGGAGSESDSDGGPAALLVEVEDEVEETAAPLVACSPRAAPQTPVYRYGQAQERHRACENTEGKLSPIPHALPVPPHPCTEHISSLRSDLASLLQNENILQKLLLGRANITERCEDVLRQIEAMKAQTLRSALVDLERRVGRMNKEKDILQSSLRNRANNFGELLTKLTKTLVPLKASCKGATDEMSSMGIEFSARVNKFIFQHSRRFQPLIRGKIECGDLTEELKSLVRGVEDLQSECNKCNLQRRDSNICISYTLKKPKTKERIIPISYEPDVTIAKESKTVESQYENVPSTSKAVYEVSVKVHEPKEDVEGVFIMSNEFKKEISEERVEESPKGAKKKVKDLSERGTSNNLKRKTKSRQRLEREKSIHSESDTEGDVSSVTIEFPRRRKPLRTRRTSDTHVAYPRQNSFEKQSNTDSGDNVFVLKLKPNNQSENSAPNTDKDSPRLQKDRRAIITKKRSLDSALGSTMSQKSLEKEDSLEIVLSSDQLSIEIPPEGIEIQASGEVSATPADVFVKTTRKIFSPVTRDSKGKPMAVIGFDLEELANSLEKKKEEEELKEINLPDVIGNKEKNVRNGSDLSVTTAASLNVSIHRGSPKLSEQLKEAPKPEEERKQFSLVTSESLGNIRPHTPSPLFMRKQTQLNSSSRTLSGSRNASEESIYHSKDVLPIRRGSGERYLVACKGSPVLSRASTPGLSGTPSALPPLPASPPSARREKPPAKETAPSIRIMIQKYNMQLHKEGAEAKPQSGVTTPPWRSPRSQEKFPHDVQRVMHHSTVRNNPFFDKEVQKSASASQIMRQMRREHIRNHEYSKENVSDGAEMTPPLPKKLLRGILKSSSAGSIKTTSPLCQRKLFPNPEEQKVVEVPKKEETKIIVDMKDSDVVKAAKLMIENVNSRMEARNMQAMTNTIDNTPAYDNRRPMIPMRSKTETNVRKMDPNLNFAQSTPCTPVGLMTEHEYLPAESSSERALRLKKAKEQFLASGSKTSNGDGGNSIRRDRNTSSHVDLAGYRLSQISCGSDTSYEGNSLIIPNKPSNGREQDSGFLMKSASVGMIHVEREAFDKFNKEKGYESLPRNQPGIVESGDGSSKSGSKFGLANLASKFRKVRLRKSKQPQSKPEEKKCEKDKMNTISKLCRQSLLVNLHSEGSQERRRETSMLNASKDGGSQTDMSILSAGKTGGAVAVGEGFCSVVDKGVSRSISMPDGSVGVKKQK